MYYSVSQYLAKSVHGSVEKISFDPLELYLVTLPTKIADAKIDSIRAKQNLLTCLSHSLQEFQKPKLLSHFED